MKATYRNLMTKLYSARNRFSKRVRSRLSRMAFGVDVTNLRSDYAEQLEVVAEFDFNSFQDAAEEMGEYDFSDWSYKMDKVDELESNFEDLPDLSDYESEIQRLETSVEDLEQRLDQAEHVLGRIDEGEMLERLSEHLEERLASAELSVSLIQEAISTFADAMKGKVKA